MTKVASVSHSREVEDESLPTISHVDQGYNTGLWRVRTFHRRYAKLYVFFVAIDVAPLKVSPSSWLVRMLAKMQEDSQEGNGLNNGTVQRLSAMVRRIAGNVAAGKLVHVPPADLSFDQVYSIFQSFEDALEGDPTLGTQKEISLAFRSCFWTYLPQVGLNGRITSSSVRFRTRFAEARRPKKLLGDFSDIHPPLGATEYVNYTDLKVKLKSRAEGALAEVQEVFLKEIEQGERLRQYLTSCAELPIHNDLLISAQRILRYHRGRKGFEWLLKDIDSYIGALVVGMRKIGAGIDNHAGRFGILFSSEIAEHISQKVGWAGVGRHQVFALEFGLLDEICASNFLIQSMGGWNVGAAVGLDTSQIWESEGNILVQGYKGKTDSDTPVITIAPDDIAGRKAISLLLWNHERMVALGYKDAKNGNLLRIVKARREDKVPEVQHFMNKLRQSHNLKGFTLGILRRQRLFIEGLSSPKDAQMLAGHLSLSTTSRYLDTEVAHRMNSSISLKMKRRMEQELLYAIGLAEERPTWALMLTPVGDGTSCSDPRNPPIGYDKEDGVCRALGCHVGDGCKNNRLVVDEERMQEAVATKKMYQSSWRKLHARNSTQFVSVHIPNILFNAALLKLMATGPYGHVLRKIENAK